MKVSVAKSSGRDEKESGSGRDDRVQEAIEEGEMEVSVSGRNILIADFRQDREGDGHGIMSAVFMRGCPLEEKR